MTELAELPEGRPLRSRLGRAVIWSVIESAFNQGSTLLVNLVVANLLGRRVFGEYAIVQATLLTIGTIAQLSTGYTAAKYVAEYRSRDPPRAGRILRFCRRISAVLVVAAIRMARDVRTGALRAAHPEWPESRFEAEFPGRYPLSA